MGYEVNAALGVKLAQPQSEVYSLVGDGSFMMLHSELVTSCRSGRRSTSFCSTTWRMAASTTCSWNTVWIASAPSFATARRKTAGCRGLVPVDFATIASGYGCKTGGSPPSMSFATRWMPLAVKPSARLSTLKYCRKPWSTNTVAGGTLAWRRRRCQNVSVKSLK